MSRHCRGLLGSFRNKPGRLAAALASSDGMSCGGLLFHVGCGMWMLAVDKTSVEGLSCVEGSHRMARGQQEHRLPSHPIP